jgi:hypothetical protein
MMADWSKIERYVRMHGGIEDVMELDRVNSIEQPMVRLGGLAKKLDQMGKKDPEFGKFAASTNLFRSLQELVLQLHKKSQEKKG